jgi:hypothetical protein
VGGYFKNITGLVLVLDNEHYQYISMSVLVKDSYNFLGGLLIRAAGTNPIKLHLRKFYPGHHMSQSIGRYTVSVKLSDFTV